MGSARPGYLAPLLSVLAVLSVCVPFLFWHEIWFGRRLTDRDLDRYLQDTARPRRVQHALSQVVERIARGESAERFYPEIAALATHSLPEIRTTAAWVMGQDNRSDLFRQSLRSLLRDPHPMVRRNAALSLVRFADSSGRAELLRMLRPELVPAPVSGEVRMCLGAGREVGSGSPLARIRTQPGTDVDVWYPAPGEVLQVLANKGSHIAEGQPIARIRPGRDQVWEALRGLYLVGRTEDLPDVEEYARAGAEVSAELRRQAGFTAEAIRSRSELDPTH